MYLLVFLTILGTAFSVPLLTAVAPLNDELREQYVLPGESHPTFYDVRLFLDPGNVAYFNGSVTIRVIPNQNTMEIVLHAMEMVIHNIKIFDQFSTSDEDNLYENYTLASDDTHFLRIFTRQDLVESQPYNVHIDYTGQYAQNMFGIYVSTYPHPGVGTVSLITSQLQPTFARRAFPCYDEPSQKAIFRTTIYAPPEYPVVRSNMPQRKDELKENLEGFLKYEFEDTLIMSSYLLAYLVSNFDYITNEDDENPIYNIPFRIYSRNGTQDTAEFALDFGQKNMLALEEYTEFKYAFPKMDKAAVPDFAAGAMENWGLVIYREVALLVQDGVTTTATKQNIGRIICHENTHMWFGNEVSPRSWTYTWLNEGFANFFENFATDFVLPEWRMMDQFVLAMQNVFQNDAVVSVNPMTHEVYTPSQILGTFNAVAYQKSGSVIRMMQHFLTPEVFRKGLVIYLQRMTRNAAEPSDLYASLQQALDESNHTIPYPIDMVMELWTLQGGFPVLTVRRSAMSAQSIFVTQERFLTDRSIQTYERWFVPINWVLSTNIDFSDTSPQFWVPINFPAQAVDIPGLSQAEWYIINKQQTGYYRVNYDVNNWRALARALKSSHNDIHLLNRAQLIDDAFNLARNGRLDYIYAFELSRYLVQETDYVPWAAASAAFSYLDVVLSGTPNYGLFQEYILHLSAPLFKSLGFDASSNEEHVTAYHRNTILNLNCRHGNANCVNKAQELLEDYRKDSSKRPKPDIQTTIYCSGLRGGDEENFNFLWNQYLETTDSSAQAILLNALGCTSNPGRREFYLNQVIDDESAVREQDRHTIIVSVINSSPENMEAALKFVMEHFPEIQPRVQGLTGTTNILNAFSRRLTSEAHAEMIKQFINSHGDIFTAGEKASVAAIQENIAASISWNENNFALVDSWLRDNYGPNSSNIISSSLFVIVSAILFVCSS